MKLTIEEHRVITLVYELREGSVEGELLERMDSRHPFTFLFGTGKLLKSFEAQLYGLGADDRFEFILKAEDAYGHSNALNILKLDVADFKRASDIPDEYIQIGNLVNVTDDENLTHNGKIIDIQPNYVQVDFNHAMVGKDLHFKGAILFIRDASIEELVQKHYIPDYGIRT